MIDRITEGAEGKANYFPFDSGTLVPGSCLVNHLVGVCQSPSGDTVVVKLSVPPNHVKVRGYCNYWACTIFSGNAFQSFIAAVANIRFRICILAYRNIISWEIPRKRLEIDWCLSLPNASYRWFRTLYTIVLLRCLRRSIFAICRTFSFSWYHNPISVRLQISRATLQYNFNSHPFFLQTWVPDSISLV